MARFEAQFRSKTKEVPPSMVPREFGGMEYSGGPSYRHDSAKFSAKDERRAHRRAHAIAKEKGMVLMKIVKFVWEKQNAVA